VKCFQLKQQDHHSGGAIRMNRTTMVQEFRELRWTSGSSTTGVRSLFPSAFGGVTVSNVLNKIHDRIAHAADLAVSSYSILSVWSIHSWRSGSRTVSR
jgi:hypothetical protein